MVTVSFFFALLLVGTQAKLQVWHRKYCPLVMDLKYPLSAMVARNFNLSAYYFNYRVQYGDKVVMTPLLKILVRELVFRNNTNRQAIAIMKFQSTSDEERGYFFVLLENCVASNPVDKTEKKKFDFQLNTTNPNFDVFGTLSGAKAEATRYESSGKWPETSHSDPAALKTNKERNIEIAAKVVAGTVLSPLLFLYCVAYFFNGSRTPPDYTRLAKHWSTEKWTPEKTFKVVSHNGDVYIINAQVSV